MPAWDSLMISCKPTDSDDICGPGVLPSFCSGTCAPVEAGFGSGGPSSLRITSVGSPAPGLVSAGLSSVPCGGGGVGGVARTAGFWEEGEACTNEGVIGVSASSRQATLIARPINARPELHAHLIWILITLPFVPDFPVTGGESLCMPLSPSTSLCPPTRAAVQIFNTTLHCFTLPHRTAEARHLCRPIIPGQAVLPPGHRWCASWPPRSV